jgi:signal transduction histidine kinase/sugar lactone lactonase YvrE
MQRNPFFLACFFIWTTTAAQQYRFASFTIDDGLSNNVVYATHQDRKGYLWIATHDGLNRYDGYEFKKFLHNPFDKKSLAGAMAIDITEDDEGGLWIITNTHLHRYNESDESFERYALPAGSINNSNESASRIADADKRFLLLNLSRGLMVFDKINKRFRPIDIEDGINEPIQEKLINVPVEKINLFNLPFFKDKEGNILVGGGYTRGVLSFDSTSITFTRRLPAFYQPLKWQDEIVTSVCRNKKNDLVYCIQEGNKFFLVTETGKKHFLLNRSITGSTIFLESMTEDAQGDIWLSYGNRLFEYLPAMDSVIDLSGNLYNTAVGDNFIIKSMCIDNFSNLWLGLYESGILKASIRKSSFLNFSIHQRGNFKLPYSSVYGLIRNPDETVIVRYYGTQMASIVDVGLKKIITPEFKFNPLDTITMKKLFSRFQQVTSSGPFYKFFDLNTRFTFNNGQFGLYKDQNRDFWAVNFNEFKRIKDNSVVNTGYHINCFYEGDDKIFWVGTDGGGLLKLNYSTGTLKNFLPSEPNLRCISSEYVNGIIPDEKKGLWLATRYGLNYFDFHTGQFKLFSEEDGLCNNIIYTIEKDKDGKLWLGTSHGLSCYDPHTNDFTNYSKNNGLVNAEYNRNGTISLSNGWILMGGTEGIDVIMPDSIKYRRETERTPLPLLVTSLQSTDTLIYSFSEPITLNHRQNNVAISFAALDFTQPRNNKYLWKLEPVEKNWTYGLGKHEVNYAGLAPGEYTFKIKAAGADGIWNDKQTTFSFVITAPWWQSWWALALLILLGIGTIVCILRLYYHRKFNKKLREQKILLEKRQAIEKERTRIATDMHDDMGASLSRIKFLSEMIGIKKQQKEPIEEDISKIRKYSDDMIDKMGEIVWALNEKNDTLSDLLAYTRAYTVEYLSQNGIQSDVQTAEKFPDLFVSGEFRRNIYLTVKEALHNIVKHSQATRVSVCVETTRELFIRIHDNGTGFDEKNIRPFSSGLTNMKKRIESLGGKLDVKNSDGSTISLLVPLP